MLYGRIFNTPTGRVVVVQGEWSHADMLAAEDAAYRAAHATELAEALAAAEDDAQRFEVTVAFNSQAQAAAAAVAALWVVVPDETASGSAVNDDGSYTAPPVRYATVTPAFFYNCFTVQERIAIKTSTDPNTKEFWETLQIQLAAAEPIDLNTPSVQNGLDYFTGHGLLVAGRKAAILAGTLQ